MKTRISFFVAACLFLLTGPAAPLWAAARFYYQDLGNLGLPMVQVNGLNDQGQVVGLSKIVSGEYGEWRGFVWTPGQGMEALGTLEGGWASGAYAINNAGQVAGYSMNASDAYRAVLWTPGQPIRTWGHWEAG
jgi:probable HAF family extracellular repeat protein